MFYKKLDDSANEKRFYYRLYRMGKDMVVSWYQRHNRIIKHAGFGGKSHLLEKGHVQWNRKGRW